MADNNTTKGPTMGDDRLKRPVGAGRVDPAAADVNRTQKDGTALTLEERRRMLRSEWNQEVLPTPPASEEWHYCWLSTTNAADPIYKRMQRGYEPVKAVEIPGFAQYKVTQGEFEGCVACNEMLLFKLPMELYQDVMSYFHHEKPMDEEELLRANVDERLDKKDHTGRGLGEVEGFDTLARRVSQPTFQ